MSSDEIVIDARNLSKRYEIYAKPRDRLKQLVLPSIYRAYVRLAGMFGIASNRPPPLYFREFWALHDVSFQVRKGETLGIIGRNGSGKSTLLQLICSTLTPTSGEIAVKGRISALLELGSGFNPEYTGRENVFLNGQILGLSQQEIESKYEAIVNFADIGNFIDQPVKTYSSGMTVRLAFSVAISVDPEILVIDEALAVGDMNFQAKCMTALTRIQERGTTVLFVSHDINALKSLCSRGVYLEHGTVRAIGDAPDVAKLYIQTMREETNEGYRKVGLATPIKKNGALQLEEKKGRILKRSDEFDKKTTAFRYGTGGAKITFVELLDFEDQPIQSVEFNQEVKIKIFFEVTQDMVLGIAFQILDERQNNIIESGTKQAGGEVLLTREGDCYFVTFTLKLPLREGTYSIQTHIAKPIHENTRPEFVDVVPNTVIFKVMPREPIPFGSAVYMFPHLKIEKVEPDQNGSITIH